MRKIAALLILALLLTAVVIQAQPAALPADNLLACSWFRHDLPPQPPFPAICNDWTRNNNLGVIQGADIPSQDALDGTAYQITRDYNYDSLSHIWQIVESPGGLRLRFSVYTRLDAGDNLTINVYGRDARYGIGGWDHLWTPLQLTGGNGAWQNSGVLEFTSPHPYRYYMIEVMGHVPMPIGTTGAALTGVYFSTGGSTLYLPTVVNGN